MCTEIPEVILASRLLNLIYYAAVSYFVIRRGFVDRQFATILFILCSSVYVLAEEPLDEVVVDSLGELFWTYLNLMLGIVKLHARLIFILIDIMAPIAITIWYTNRTNDPIKYPNGAPVSEAKYVLYCYALWPLLMFASTGPWFWLHKIFFFGVVPVYISFLALVSWFNWWTNSDVKQFEIVPRRGIIRKQFTYDELHPDVSEDPDNNEDSKSKDTVSPHMTIPDAPVAPPLKKLSRHEIPS